MGGGTATDTEIDFVEVYRAHRSELISYAARRGAHDPELLADQALTDCYRAIDRLHSRHPKVVLAYLYRALTSHLARERSLRRLELRNDLEELGQTLSFEDELVGDVDLEAVLSILPPGQEQALRLRLFDNLSSEEAGTRLGKSAAAVRQLQHQGLLRLRRLGYGAALAALVVLAGVVAVLYERTQVADQSPITTPNSSTTTTQPASVSISGGPGPTAPLAPGPPTTALDVSTTQGTTARGALPVESTATTAPTGSPGSPVVATPTAYDGFDLGLVDGGELAGVPGGGSATGFGQASIWETTAGSLAVVYDAAGLDYVDAGGSTLQTAPGAIQVRSLEPWSTLSRPLAAPLPAGSTVWVSYLIRLDSEAIDDGFWTPGVNDAEARSAFGVQNSDRFRFVNTAPSGPAIERGRTHLLVAQFRPDGASLWVDPTLADLGPPTLTVADVPRIGSTPGFSVFDRVEGDVVYTLDEYRVGDSYAAVAPTAAGR